MFHNAEMGPAEPNTNQSQLNIFTASPGEQIIHTNKYGKIIIYRFVGFLFCRCSDIFGYRLKKRVVWLQTLAKTVWIHFANFQHPKRRKTLFRCLVTKRESVTKCSGKTVAKSLSRQLQSVIIDRKINDIKWRIQL